MATLESTKTAVTAYDAILVMPRSDVFCAVKTSLRRMNALRH